MLGSLGGSDVVGGEEDVLLVFARQGTALGWPAGGAAGPGLGSGLAGHAVLEELLVLVPPLLPEQWLADLLPRAPPGHSRALRWGGPQSVGRATIRPFTWC